MFDSSKGNPKNGISLTYLVADIRLADISIALFTPTPSSHPLPSSPVPEGPGIRPLMLALSSQPNSHTQQASEQ
jgi:hypothetical protein